MNETTTVLTLRKTLAIAISALVLLMSLVLTPNPAHAAPVSDPTTIDGDAQTTLVIHKVEQPQDFGVPGNGLPIDDPAQLPPAVQGAEFAVTPVPGLDITTYEGWRKATEMTADQAKTLIADAAPLATGVTDAQGALQFTLPVGLYYVEETSVPAGVIAAEPFLAVTPMPAPDTSDWLYTVHVYPKNPRVAVTKTVADCEAVTLGDTVTWASQSDIPRATDIDGYRVQNLIVPELRLIDTAEEVLVTLNGGAPTLERNDYITSIVTVDGKITVQVDFTDTGRAKLAEAKAGDAEAHVEITYRTEVLDEGTHVNEVRLYPDLRAVNGATPPVTDDAVTKWGPLSVVVHEIDNPAHLIEGATFKLYLTPEDAIAGTNEIVVEGVSEWVTDEQGRLIIHGLRFSHFANGLDLEPGADCALNYWAMPTFVPEGWNWVNDKPLSGTVTDTLEYQTLIFEVEKVTAPPTPELPITGGQIAGIIVLATVLIGGGALALITRKRRSTEERTQ